MDTVSLNILHSAGCVPAHTMNLDVFSDLRYQSSDETVSQMNLPGGVRTSHLDLECVGVNKMVAVAVEVVAVAVVAAVFLVGPSPGLDLF